MKITEQAIRSLDRAKELMCIEGTEENGGGCKSCKYDKWEECPRSRIEALIERIKNGKEK